MDPTFLLDARTLSGIGALLGAMVGTITYLMRRLIDSKDLEVANRDAEIAALRAERDQMTGIIRVERDYFRNVAFRALGHEPPPEDGSG